MARQRYDVLVPKRVEKQIRALAEPAKRRVVDCIASLAFNPRPAVATKLTSREEYRLRVGDYRILYLIEDVRVIVTIAQVKHRREVYR